MKNNFLYNLVIDLEAINPNKSSMVFNFFMPNSFHILFWYRVSHILGQTKLKILARVINAIVRIVYSCDISPFAIIGEKVVFMHGFDIVIGSNVYIGNNVKIFNGTTFGNRGGKHPDGQPRIEDGCTIGTGAKLLGRIRIGQDCMVGANSVVLNSFPASSIIVGVPAKKVK